MANFIIGLTGGIGSGKTTVSNLFEKQGIDIIDADIISRQVVAIGSWGLNAIVAHFGSGILNPDGSLNRRSLREQIFRSESQRTWLNNLLHPLIREEILKQLNDSNSCYCILVAPLLFENKLDKLTNRALVIDISPQQQTERTMARDNVSSQQVTNIIKSQAPREDKLALADDIIDNQGSIVSLESQVLTLHKHYLSLAEQSR